MTVITEKGLKRNLGRQTTLEREGLKGNSRYIDGRVQEGRTFGILCEDEKGFYVKQFVTWWEEDFGRVIDKKHFYDQVCRIQERDLVSFSRGNYLVRFS